MDALESIFGFLNKLADVSPINAILTAIILGLLLVIRKLLFKMDTKDLTIQRAYEIIDKNTETLAKQHTMFTMLVERINSDRNRGG